MLTSTKNFQSWHSLSLFSTRVRNYRTLPVKSRWRIRVPHVPWATHARHTRQWGAFLQDGRIWKNNASQTNKKHADGETGPGAWNEARKRWHHQDACQVRFTFSWERDFRSWLFSCSEQWWGTGKLSSSLHFAKLERFSLKGVESNSFCATTLSRIGWKNSLHFAVHWEVEQKSIVPCSHTFSPVSRQLHVFASSFDWFTV